MCLTGILKFVTKSYFYDDFGNLWGNWGSVENRYLYTGQEYDADVSGAELYNLRARYYKTGIGRFVSQDPTLSEGDAINIQQFPYNRIYLPQELNAYLYVTNNPLNFIDISGLDRYKACEKYEGIANWICKRIVDGSCFFNKFVCCFADMANCIADLLGINDEEAEQEAEKIKECPSSTPPELEECYLKYMKCLGMGEPTPLWPR